ncbi:unnamed protein product, partial [Polarella glacialis]
ARLPCAPTVDNVAAIKACEAAAGQCGFRVVAKTRRSLLLMPCGPQLRSSAFSCLAAGFAGSFDGGSASSSSGSASLGRGITAELVAPNETRGELGLAISVATSRAQGGEAFVSALSLQLEGLVASRSGDPSSGGLGLEDTEGGGAGSSRFKRESQAYYYFSKLLCDTGKEPGRTSLDFTQRFS